MIHNAVETIYHNGCALRALAELIHNDVTSTLSLGDEGRVGLAHLLELLAEEELEAFVRLNDLEGGHHDV